MTVKNYVRLNNNSITGWLLSWRIFGFCGMAALDKVWFRVRPRGYGLSVSRRSTHWVMLGEREGWRRVHYFGPIVWEFLRPLGSDEAVRLRTIA